MNISGQRLEAFMAILLVAVAHGIASAQASRFTEWEVAFRNGPVELRGTLTLPVVQGRHPTVIFLHGTGPATRAGARMYAEESASIGVASLVFDTRGSGSSSGSWSSSSLDDLAADALAAVGYLRTQEGVDPGRIGF